MSLSTTYLRAKNTALVQAFVLGLISFAESGIWTALLVTGAGGLQTTHTANTANVILFVLMTATSPFAAVLVNRIGIKWCGFIGCLGFPFYLAGLYYNSKTGAQWFVLLGSALTGLTAQFLWVAEGSAAVFFPSDERSLFVGIWQLVNKFGLLVAGSITLSLNVGSSSSGSVSLNTYIGFITINCIGILLSFFIAEPQKVIRRDGSYATTNLTNETWKARLSKVVSVYKRKEVLLIAPLSLASMWFQTWQSNFITDYFSVRSRALNTFVTAFVQMAADLSVGFLLDSKRISKPKKLRWSWHIINVGMVGFYIYAFIIQGVYMKNPPKGLDWTDSGFSRGFVPYVLFKFFQEALTNWIYWVAGEMKFHSSEITYVVSVIRGSETFGEMWGFIIGSLNNNNMTNLAVAGGLWFVIMPSVTYLIHYVVEEVAAINEERNRALDADLKTTVETYPDLQPKNSDLEKTSLEVVRANLVDHAFF